MRIETIDKIHRVNPVINFFIVAIILLPSLTIIGVIISYPLYMLYGLIRYALIEPGALSDGREAFKKFCGFDPKYFDCDTHLKGNGYFTDGVAIDGDNLYILREGVAAEIPWGKVRGWETKIAGFDTLVGVGMSASLTASTNNIQAMQRAAMVSGLFVQVADIEHPEWHVQTTDQAFLKRWAEILTQRSENRLAA